jgi:hypothetical protein
MAQTKFNMKLETCNLTFGYLKNYVENVFVLQTEPAQDGFILNLLIPESRSITLSIFKAVKVKETLNSRQYENCSHNGFHIELIGNNQKPIQKIYIGAITEISIVFSPNTLSKLINRKFLPTDLKPIRTFSTENKSKECLLHNMFDLNTKDKESTKIIEYLLYELSLINTL